MKLIDQRRQIKNRSNKETEKTVGKPRLIGIKNDVKISRGSKKMIDEVKCIMKLSG